MSAFLRVRSRGRGAIRALLGVLSLCLPLIAATASISHEGHDHGPEPAGAGAPPSPRVIADTEDFQAVGILEGEVLVIYLDRARDNAPVVGASVEVTVDADVLKAEPQENGTYEVVSPVLKAPGEKEILITVKEGEVNDLLAGTLRVPQPAAPQPSGNLQGLMALLQNSPLKDVRLTGLSIRPEWLAVGAPLLLGFGFGAAFRARPRTLVVIFLVGAVLAVATTGVRAHEGHDHGAEAATGSNGNAPGRRPDGSIFLPKPTQRLLEVRTVTVEPETTTRSVRFSGRVIPNPNRSGVVQSTIPGRVNAPLSGLPRLGQAVKAGDILGYVQPSFASIDASDMLQTAGDLEQQISLVQARLERLRRLAAADIASKASLEEAEIQLQGLRRRREELKQVQSRPEALRSPVDGVVAETSLVSGQVVSPSDILLRIVDPAGFWVEALVYDQASPDAVKAASAVTVDDAKLKLAFVGRSRALQQQATLVHFEIADPPASLDAGAPVTVIATTGESVTGIVLPRSALAQSPNGQTVVFHHKEAELFVPKAVRVENLDADRVLIVSGIAKGDKVVVRNAPLVNQVR